MQKEPFSSNKIINLDNKQINLEWEESYHRIVMRAHIKKE